MTIQTLLDKWLDREGGAERANHQMFLSELAQALGLPTLCWRSYGHCTRPFLIAVAIGGSFAPLRTML